MASRILSARSVCSSAARGWHSRGWDSYSWEELTQLYTGPTMRSNCQLHWFHTKREPYWSASGQTNVLLSLCQLSLGCELPVPLPAPAALLTDGRCRPQRPWGSSSLPPYQVLDSAVHRPYGWSRLPCNKKQPSAHTESKLLANPRRERTEQRAPAVPVQPCAGHMCGRPLPAAPTHPPPTSELLQQLGQQRVLLLLDVLLKQLRRRAGTGEGQAQRGLRDSRALRPATTGHGRSRPVSSSACRQPTMQRGPEVSSCAGSRGEVSDADCCPVS